MQLKINRLTALILTDFELLHAPLLNFLNPLVSLLSYILFNGITLINVLNTRSYIEFSECKSTKLNLLFNPLAHSLHICMYLFVDHPHSSLLIAPFDMRYVVFGINSLIHFIRLFPVIPLLVPHTTESPFSHDSETLTSHHSITLSLLAGSIHTILRFSHD